MMATIMAISHASHVSLDTTITLLFICGVETVTYASGSLKYVISIVPCHAKVEMCVFIIESYRYANNCHSPHLDSWRCPATCWLSNHRSAKELEKPPYMRSCALQLPICKSTLLADSQEGNSQHCLVTMLWP